MHALIERASRIVPMIDAMIDPRHPRRLEKKTNISRAGARSPD